MHCMVYHVPECIRRYVIYESFQAKVCISIDGDSEWKLQCNFFICLGVENHNDDAKRAYFSSNKWNARIDCL